MISIPAARTMARGIRIHQKRKNKQINMMKPILQDEKSVHQKLERAKQNSNNKRISNLNSLIPSADMNIPAAATKPTKGRGGRIFQPGGGSAGN